MSRSQPSPRPSRVARELAALLAPGAAVGRDPVVGWGPVLELAAQHQLLPALWAALVAGGVRPLPDELAHPGSPLAVLQRAHAENVLRSRDLRVHLERVLDTLEATGIAAVPIKGAHWLLAGGTGDAAARVMVDVDVLVPRPLASEAHGALIAVGYEPVDEVADAPHQLRPLVLPGRRGSVELHVAPLVAAHAMVLSADDIWEQATAAPDHRRGREVPSATHAMVLLIAHAQLQDEGTRLLHLPLRAVADIARLPPAVADSVDWSEVQARFDRAGREAAVALAGFAMACAELVGIELPVQRRSGAAWLRAAMWAIDHPSAAGLQRQLAYLPIALRPERMEALYGAEGRAGRLRARTRHVVGGAAARATGRRDAAR